jgi:uncharacterized membrane protein
MSRFARLSICLAIFALSVAAIPDALHTWAVLVNDPPGIYWETEGLAYTLLMVVPAILLVVTLWRDHKRP